MGANIPVNVGTARVFPSSAGMRVALFDRYVVDCVQGIVVCHVVVENEVSESGTL